MVCLSRLPRYLTCVLSFLGRICWLTWDGTVLPLANQIDGHRLGVNGLAVDSDGSILYATARAVVKSEY